MNIDKFQLDLQTKILSATKTANLEVFKKYMPSIYEAFKDYSPVDVKLTFDPNGFLNLVDNGNLVYGDGEDPKESVRKQFHLYKHNTQRFVYKPNTDFENEYNQFTHGKYLQQIKENCEQEIGTAGREMPFNSSVPIMVAVGVGLGYQLEMMLEEFNMHHLYVYEPSMDVFFASLHVIDYLPFFQKLTVDGRSLTFKIGDPDKNSFINCFAGILGAKSFAFASRIYVYRHYMSELATDAFQVIHDLVHRVYMGWGFFEDEIVSFAHTIANADNDPSYVKKEDNIPPLPNPDIPVFIIGAGPSLDNDIEFIKKHKNEAVIVCGGSALKTLFKHDIVPDYHIEIERTDIVIKWNEIFPKEYLDKITMIGNNTLHPEAYKMFGESHCFLKKNDAGVDFIKSQFGEQALLLAEPEASNPTVSNGALATSCLFGFKNIYLFGVDLGYKDPKKHHAQDTHYYSKDGGYYKEEMPTDLIMESNFGEEEIFSEHTFDSTRFLLEYKLNQHPDVKCYNCSDGAKVAGTTPLRSEEIEISTSAQEKEQVLKHIKETAYISIERDFRLLERADSLLPAIRQITNGLKTFWDEPMSHRDDMYKMFHMQHVAIGELSKTHHAILSQMMKGTMNYLQSTIATFAMSYETEEDAMKYLGECKEIFVEYMDFIYELSSKHYVSLHGDYESGNLS